MLLIRTITMITGVQIQMRSEESKIKRVLIIAKDD